MCGYHGDSDSSIDPGTVSNQLEGLEPKGEVAKIYTSGSFLDPAEISACERTAILEFFRTKGLTRVVVESRPEFVNDDVLSDIGSTGLERFEVAFGLESSSDRVRELCINKGFTFEQYTQAAMAVRDSGFGVRTYLLFKPPYLTESGAIEDLSRSIRDCAPYTDVISINPMNIQRGTPVEELFKKGYYRPPWYYSLFRVLENAGGVEIVSFPSGGSTPRGIHNCRKCDKSMTEILDAYNCSKKVPEVDKLACECKEEWAASLDAEPRSLNVTLTHRSQNWD